VLIFEPLAVEDLPFLIEVRNDCRDCLHDNRVFTLAECQTWFSTKHPDFYVIKRAGKRIGYFRLSNHDPENASIYVGADLHKRHRGKGLARAAYEAFLPLLKDRYHVSTVKLEVLSHNAVALALYRKLGFVETDRKRGFGVRKGVPVDSIVMQLKL
jgi:RimJ/RimL family protein N-acetyltransferase